MSRTALLLLALATRFSSAAPLVVELGIGADSLNRSKPESIGSRLELFVDKQLIDTTFGDLQLKVQAAEPREVVLVTDQPWEGNTSAYYTVFQDGGKFRMYYRGAHYDEVARRAAHREVTCYAESRDGIHWVKPELGLFEFNGSKKNNIVWDGVGTHCFTVFKDSNPKAAANARYKAISRGRPQAEKGLYVFGSPDGIHWRLLRDKPVITDGDFDSQNLAFFDAYRGRYLGFHRKSRRGKRDIMTETSPDFLNWTRPQFLEYPDAPAEHLYTNAILVYDRAPHLLLGFPTRYLPRQGSRVEPTLMASRDGRVFHRWLEPLISEDAPSDRKGNRSNYMVWGLVRIPGNDREYSVYGTEAYYTGPDSRVRRFTFRVDGFVAATSGAAGGGLVTRAVSFAGNRLVVNYAAAAGGSLRVELLDGENQVIRGFAAADCVALEADELAGQVKWAGKTVGELEGKPIKLRFLLKNAKLYSYQFRN